MHKYSNIPKFSLNCNSYQGWRVLGLLIICFVSFATVEGSNEIVDETQVTNQNAKKSSQVELVRNRRLLRGTHITKLLETVLSSKSNNLEVIDKRLYSEDKKIRKLNTCRKKEVQIYKFCINGDDDSGAYGEHQLRLDATKYYPNNGSDCPQDPSGYCEWREGQCHNLNNPPWRSVEPYKSLTVGTEEHDSTSENDSTFAYLSANDWYNPTCNTYEVVMARDFSSKKDKSICWNVGGSVGGSKGGIEGEINAGVESCTKWTEPAESFIWFMTVSPALYDYSLTRSKLHYGYCLDIPSSDTNNGIDLILWQCHGGDNQHWAIDENGYIRSKLNPKKCLDPQGPSVANGAPAQIWDCVDNYLPQKWTITPSGEIRSQWNPSKCIDIAGAEIFNGNKIIVWDCHGGNNQKWYF
jgi:hypothetical protein